MHVIFAAVFITCSQQHVLDVLAVERLGTCSAKAAAEFGAINKQATLYLYDTQIIIKVCIFKNIKFSFNLL